MKSHIILYLSLESAGKQNVTFFRSSSNLVLDILLPNRGGRRYLLDPFELQRNLLLLDAIAFIKINTKNFNISPLAVYRSNFDSILSFL